jgi:tRNA-splicing ligase RtcB (3'-phosphate/5'-hydroxy nucleic acid ligase)
MKKSKISNKDLRQLGISHPESLIAISREANLLIKKRIIPKRDLIQVISEMLTDISNEKWKAKPFATLFTEIIKAYDSIEEISNDRFFPPNVAELKEMIPFPIYGGSYIEAGAVNQMETAMRLPIAQMGALMPDAHKGYGLPIGGVLATTEDTVIPYAVGVDIACRMCMSVFPHRSEYFESNRYKLKSLLGKHTVFGVGTKNKEHFNTDVFERPEWNETRFIRQHRDLAFSQLGTSGAGNHFAEWGELLVLVDIPELNLIQGEYLSLLSHSGSRGFGNETATYYSKIAMEKIKLPKEAKHLAWLNLNSQEGQEYWIAMNLAGHYASANHHEIHSKIIRELGTEPIARVENHHNFAWRERLSNGKYGIVHRKGATPAGESVIGIIPGSMTHPGFVVRGRGNQESLNSASHGAGRSMSRAQALKQFDGNDLQRVLEKYNVELIGGDIDEIPMAYKDIESVMAFQKDLVEVLAIFQPRIVRMADPDRRRKGR